MPGRCASPVVLLSGDIEPFEGGHLHGWSWDFADDLPCYEGICLESWWSVGRWPGLPGYDPLG